MSIAKPSVESGHRAWIGCALAVCLLAAPALGVVNATSTPAQETNQHSARLLSAFFGLDNRLPPRANLLCAGAAGKDGMPVVLSHTIHRETLQAEDFRVDTRGGAEHVPQCVTLRPAQDPGEHRTVLLIGEFGNDPEDPPVRVVVAGDLLSDGSTGKELNFRGEEVQVTELAAGPTLVWAQIVPKEEWLGSTRERACPKETAQVVRVTWAGGVRLPDGGEAGEKERALYRVTVAKADGAVELVSPTSLADLGDNDNNHLLCLATQDPARAVSFPGGHFVDPNRDLNPDTEVAVGDAPGAP